VVGRLAFLTSIEQRLDQDFRQRQLTGDGLKRSVIDTLEQCGEDLAKFVVPFQRIHKHVGIEIDAACEGGHACQASRSWRRNASASAGDTKPPGADPIT
jgi:hypothetical protein